MWMSSSVSCPAAGPAKPLPVPKRPSDGAQPFAVCGPSEATSGRSALSMSSPIGCRTRKAANCSGRCLLPGPKQASDGVQPFAVCGPSEEAGGEVGDDDDAADRPLTLRAPRMRYRLQQMSATYS